MKPWQCDILGLAGVATAGGGLWWIYPPLALVALGGLLAAMAVLLARRAKRDT